MGCKKSQGFLETAGWSVTQTTDASKERKGREEALKLAGEVEVVVVARSGKVVVFDMKQGRPDDDALAAALLGPTGNLKAPTLRLGGTLLVGFGEEAYRQVLGG
jgi:hypothetical protein